MINAYTVAEQQNPLNAWAGLAISCKGGVRGEVCQDL